MLGAILLRQIPKAVRLVPCPYCLAQRNDMRFQRKGIFIKAARIVCRCGVCGPWIPFNHSADAAERAARGWAGTFGQPVRHKPVIDLSAGVADAAE